MVNVLQKLATFLVAVWHDVAVRAQFLPLPEVSYQFEKLEPDFSAYYVRRHVKEIYEYHVERFNRALKQLRHTAAYRKILKRGGIDALLRRIADVPGALQRKLRYHAGGYVNHELFFRMLRPRGGGSDASMVAVGPASRSNSIKARKKSGADAWANPPQAGCPLLVAIEQSFRSFNAFRKEFSDLARGLQGVGWIWLVVDSASERVGEIPFQLKIVESAVNDHPLSVSPTNVPILCLDVWEHAYFGQFHSNRKRYIEAWWNLVNWEEVDKAFSDVEVESRVMVVSGSPTFDFDASSFVPVPLHDFEGNDFNDFVPMGNYVTADLVVASKAAWKASFEVADGGACWSSLLELLRNAQPSGSLALDLRCSFAGSQAPALAGGDLVSTWGRAPVVVSIEAFAAGDVILEWPLEYTLHSKRLLSDHDVPGDSLSELVATLIVENRRTNSSWHSYLEYLHSIFDKLQQSALFWPQLLLQVLNVTTGLDSLRLAARSHRSVARLFEASPELLDPSASSRVPGSGDRSQALFDAEIYWAISSALCRGIQAPLPVDLIGSSADVAAAAASHGSSRAWFLLPGSELLLRGDSRTANVRLRQRATRSDSVSSVDTWDLVAIAPIKPGDHLVLNSSLSNVDLLACSWPPLQGNTHGPALALPVLDVNAVEHAMQLSREAQENNSRATGRKWQEQGCAGILVEPRLDRLEHAGFSRGLVLCIAYAIRLLEADLARGSKQEADGAPSAAVSPSENSSKVRHSKDDVLYQAYGLIGQACEEAGAQQQASLSMLSAREHAGAPWELEMATKLQAAVEDDLALLQRCSKHASQQSIRSRSRAEARSLASAKPVSSDPVGQHGA